MIYVNPPKASDINNLVQTTIKCLMRDPTAIADVAAITTDKLYTAFQKIPFNKFLLYLSGVKKAEDDLGEACAVSDKLFDDEKKRIENAERIVEYVTRMDTDSKIGHMVNASRSLIIGNLSTADFFRICKALGDTLTEDLEYLSSIIEKRPPFKGNTQIIALAQNGMMITAGIDANRGIEEQNYGVTDFGYMIDQWALSLDNDERQKWYRQNKRSKLNLNGPRPMSEEEISNILKESDE